MKFVFCCFSLLGTFFIYAQPVTPVENIFIITTDGFRWQEVFNGADSALVSDSRYVADTALTRQMFWDTSPDLRRKKLMPFFWTTISNKGQIYGNRNYQNNVNVSNIYKISYPGYNEMFTGYADPVFIPNIPVQNPNINILEYLNEKKQFKGKVAAFSSWNVFSSILNRNRNNLPVNSGYESVSDDSSLNNALINAAQAMVLQQKNTRYDLLTFLSAREYLEHHQPRVMLIGFGETDEFAHNGRYDLYLQQAGNVDKMIAELWYYVQSNDHYRNKTAFIITTDHGRGKKSSTWYKHGILTKGSGETWFAFLGPGIAPFGEIRSVGQNYQKQIASTIAQLLGEEFNTGTHPVSIKTREIFQTNAGVARDFHF